MSDFLNGLQAILGTNKKNPMFAVYRDAQKGELHVYYGFELLEVVPDDKSAPRFKLMVAQLYNAGVKGLTLIEVFGVDPKSMRKWGRALKSGDPETLVKALQGRGNRRITPEIKAYLRRRFPILYAENPRNYSSRMRREIAKIFDVKLSGEGLRPLFHELKAQLNCNQSGLPENEKDCEQTATSNDDVPQPFTLPQSTTSSTADAADDPPDAPQPSRISPAPDSIQALRKAEQPSAKKGASAV
jgi:hypothetical protein